MQVSRAVFGAERKAIGAVRGGGKGKKAKEAAKGAKKKKGIWPFGGKKVAEEASTCPSCGKETDPSWEACPYCRAPLGAEDAPAAAGPAVPGGGPKVPMVQGDKTMAIDIASLTKPKRGVVGWIVVMSGNQKGQDFRLLEGKNAIGAGADNDIVITDDYLSSKHATIRFEDGRYELIDADSTNGSFVNEKRATKEELIDNDTVRLGRTELRFKALY